MAIVRKQDKVEPKFPEDVRDAVNNVFELQAVYKLVEESLDTAKKDCLDTIGNSSEVTMVFGETFKTPDGILMSFERKNSDFDLDTMIDAVKAGKVSLDDFASCVRGFNREQVTKVFEGIDGVVVDKDPTEVIAFRASAKLKAELAESLPNPADAGHVIRQALKASSLKKVA